MQIRAEEGIKQLGLQTGAFCGNDVHPKPRIFVVSEVGKWSVVDDGVQLWDVGRMEDQVKHRDAERATELSGSGGYPGGLSLCGLGGRGSD